MKKYLHQLLDRYFSFFTFPQDLVFKRTGKSHSLQPAPESKPDVVILNGCLHYVEDIQDYLEKIKTICKPETRILISYYSNLWKPLIQFATLIGLRREQGPENWITPSDLKNFLELAGMDLIHSEARILFPVPIPFFSSFINRWIAPLPFFQWLALVHVDLARVKTLTPANKPSVSVVVAARNEEGNISSLFDRLPLLGSKTELIVVEGGSTDQTWNELQKASVRPSNPFTTILARQDGIGKGDAIRKGFSLSQNDILMILDADLTVAPEDLIKFYEALVQDKGEFINGSRLVYPMENQAMRFMNMIGNKFFALAFSYLLGQDYKDTLCGTKVIRRNAYSKLAANRSYFGEFDPFGDFDLIFGATRMGLKVIELPIRYRERVYGETNIQRWKHGWILLKMTWFAARKIKFI